MIFINCCQGELQLFSVVKAIVILCAAFTRACLLAADNSFANDRRNRNWRAHPAGRKKYIIGPLAIYGIQRSARPNLSYGELCDMIRLKSNRFLTDNRFLCLRTAEKDQFTLLWELKSPWHY